MKLTELNEKIAEPDGEQMDIPQEPLRPSAWISPFGLKAFPIITYEEVDVVAEFGCEG